MTAAFQNPPGASDVVSAKDGAGKIRLRVSYGGAIIPVSPLGCQYIGCQSLVMIVLLASHLREL